MRSIQNVNGSQYLVLDENRVYSLLANITSSNQFVVAYRTTFNDDGCFWAQGSYFPNIFSALECYKKAISKQ